MTFKAFHLVPLILLLFIALSCTTHTHANRDIPNFNKLSPFEFLNQLKGCHKGNKTKEIHQLKNYLNKFGYLDLNQTHSDNDDFDDALEAAVKMYQHNYHINSTGVLDADTLTKMYAPRCGVPDIIRGTNFMQGRSKHDLNSSNFHIVSHYTFFTGSPRWPSTTTHLTYGFSPNTNPQAIGPVASAFSQWASVTHFTFSQVQNIGNADIVIGFHRGDHGDGSQFDGPGGTLAHAFAPTDGRFHLDADELWSIRPIPNAFHLETIAVHEIGHLLGLGHSDVEEAIMYPTIAPGGTKSLHADDIQGIRTLYNV